MSIIHGIHLIGCSENGAAEQDFEGSSIVYVWLSLKLRIDHIGYETPLDAIRTSPLIPIKPRSASYDNVLEPY